MNDQNSNQEEFIHDIDDIFHIESEGTDFSNQEYRGVIVIDDDDCLSTVNNVVKAVVTLIFKIIFVHISNWKAFVKLSLYVRSDNDRHESINEIRKFTNLHQTHVYMSRECILHIEITHKLTSCFLLNFE